MMVTHYLCIFVYTFLHDFVDQGKKFFKLFLTRFIQFLKFSD